MNQVLQIQAHPYFNEQLAHFSLAPGYTDRLAELLPEDWTTERQDIWIHAHPRESSIPAQGFKIHVSAAPHFAQRILGLVVPVCVAHGVDFKIVGDRDLHAFLDSKRQPRGSSGKFMTAYPSGEAACSDLIEDLYRHTREEAVAGPRILSDRQYKDSRILYYRYGGFRPPRKVRIDGTHDTFLVSPDDRYVKDQRLGHYHAPPWVRDPFSRRPETSRPESVLLGDRYLIESALGFSNSGGLYYGTDTKTGEPVFVKEARPLTNCWGVGEEHWDAPCFLRREFSMLERLDDLGFCPDPVGLFEESEHTFLVEQRVFATGMRGYWARNDVIIAPYIRSPGRIDVWVEKFRQVAAELIRMVDAVHRKGVLIGDLSPENILIDPDSMKMWIVDFESAVTTDDEAPHMRRAVLWGTPGFLDPERVERDELLPADDYFALGMVLYSGLVAVNTLFSLNPSAQSLFLDKFVALGLPGAVRDVIVALLRGDVGEADRALATLG